MMEIKRRLRRLEEEAWELTPVDYDTKLREELEEAVTKIEAMYGCEAKPLREAWDKSNDPDLKDFEADHIEECMRQVHRLIEIEEEA